MNLYEEIYKLVEYGVRTELIDEPDRIYTINRIMEIYGEENFGMDPLMGEIIKKCELNLVDILERLTQIAYERGMIPNDGITQKDLFDTKLMGVLVELYKVSPEQATEYFYEFSQNTNYIRRDRIKKDVKWKYMSPY